MRLDGTLNDYPLSDIFQLIFLGKRSGTLHIYSGGDEGKIVFAENLLRFANTKKLKGLPAVRDILGWQTGKFVFDTEELTELEDGSSIELPIQQFILALSTEKDECEDLRTKIGGETRRLYLVSVAPGNKPVSLSPMEWQVITHLGDSPTVKDLEGRLALPERDLLRVIVELCGRGLLTIE
ncbi:DUF4388 domain-containing protein [bacterium]|nr:DUF4388 domain-containing protein [bacterium]